MNLRTLIFTHNACYKAGRTIVPKGIMVHSTGAPNPTLKRYVGPDDGLLGKNQYNNHWNQNTPDGRQVCVHGFIGKLADGSIATYQTLPWNYRSFHCGGDGNNTHISFEICEDGLTDAAYFNKVYHEAVELCAHLCRMYGFDPLKDGVIIGHYEGHKRGIASGHSDPDNWFPKHGKSMDTFRAAVKAVLAGGGVTPPTPEPIPAPLKPLKITAGALVEVKPGTEHYHPGGNVVPTWVISDYHHKVTKITDEDKVVIKGGKTCVLLGKKVKKSGGLEEAGINTWVDVDTLTLVSAPLDDDGGNDDTIETYTVKQGDTLWGIAAAKLDNYARYPEIAALNGLTSDIITIGQKLKIPK